MKTWFSMLSSWMNVCFNLHGLVLTDPDLWETGCNVKRHLSVGQEADVSERFTNSQTKQADHKERGKEQSRETNWNHDSERLSCCTENYYHTCMRPQIKWQRREMNDDRVEVKTSREMFHLSKCQTRVQERQRDRLYVTGRDSTLTVRAHTDSTARGFKQRNNQCFSQRRGNDHVSNHPPP